MKYAQILLLIGATHGLTTTSTTESEEKWVQACQFRKLSMAKDEIIQKCSDGTEAEHVICSNPIMEEAQVQILKDCCGKCFQCSGCEDNQEATTAEYELDSPGEVPPPGAGDSQKSKPSSASLRANLA